MFNRGQSSAMKGSLRADSQGKCVCVCVCEREGVCVCVFGGGVGWGGYYNIMNWVIICLENQ